MRLVTPTVELIPQDKGFEGALKQIEIAGRTAYKSEDRIKEGSAERFVNMLKERGHLSVFEHGTIYLKTNIHDPEFDLDMVHRYEDNCYSRANYHLETWYITTNYRVIVQNEWEDDLKYWCEPEEYHDKRYTARFISQIAISREANRHRADSIVEQSTRACNYSKEKFFGEVAISLPHFTSIEEVNGLPNKTDYLCDLFENYINGYMEPIFKPLYYWVAANEFCEYCYLMMIEGGMLPEDARTVLPLDTNTEFVHTAYLDQWENFFNQRSSEATTGKPHPDIVPLADKLKKLLKDEIENKN